MVVAEGGKKTKSENAEKEIPGKKKNRDRKKQKDSEMEETPEKAEERAKEKKKKTSKRKLDEDGGSGEDRKAANEEKNGKSHDKSQSEVTKWDVEIVKTAEKLGDNNSSNSREEKLYL